MPFYTVTSVTLCHLNSINTMLQLQLLLGIFLGYFWDIFGRGVPPEFLRSFLELKCSTFFTEQFYTMCTLTRNATCISKFEFTDGTQANYFHPSVEVNYPNIPALASCVI